MTTQILNNHGDLVLKPIEMKIPKTAKKSKIHILQSSGTTGNRHEVISKKSPIFRWEKDSREFISCKEDYVIQHVGGDEEHGKQNVEKGTREILHEMEHDAWKNELRRVID
jgi:hypothetical protein